MLSQMDGSKAKDPMLEVVSQIAYADRILLNKQVRTRCAIQAHVYVCGRI